MQLVLQLPRLIPLSKRPLSGHRTPDPASYISAITCPSDNRIVSGDDSFNRVDNTQAIARFWTEQDGILVFSPYLTTCRP